MARRLSWVGNYRDEPSKCQCITHATMVFLEHFRALTMKSEDFKNIQKLAEEVLNTTKLQISQVSWIMVNKENPKMVKTKKSFNELEEWTECNVLKKGKRIQDILTELPLLECKNRISAEKIKNLEDMLEYIPLKYLSYWENLIDDAKKPK